MGWKDKIKGWLIFTDGGILVIFLLIALAVAASLSCFYTIEKIRNKPEFARVVVLALGGVAAACGLVLAARRSTKFSEQVETGQKQLFNEQLGRAAELLTKDQKPMRRASIRILEGLAETTINQGLSKENVKQAQLIMRIIHDFVHAETRPPPKKKENLCTRIKNGEEKLDIALGIRTLVSLYNESGKPDDFKELVQFRRCRLEGLIFSGAKLQGVEFILVELQGANFKGSNLQEAKLGAAKLQQANFTNAELQGADFTNAELQGANFTNAELQVADFAELQWANFTNAELQGANFTNAKLQKVNFDSAKLEWADCTDADFSSAKDLTEAQVEVMIFEDSTTAKLPKSLKKSLNEDRKYKKTTGRRRFVKSKAAWSGKWVDEYLAEIGIHNPKDDG